MFIKYLAFQEIGSKGFNIYCSRKFCIMRESKTIIIKKIKNKIKEFET